MGFELGPNRYGKAGIHLATVVRGEERHEFSEREIEVRLEGDFDEVHTEGDNATVLPTDTMRSSAFALAFEHPEEALEAFALRYTSYLLDASPAANRAEAWMSERPWERVVIDGGPTPTRSRVEPSDGRRTWSAIERTSASPAGSTSSTC
jgi:urate oxidase